MAITGILAMSSQTELFEATTTWFHVFRSMIDSGDVKALGPYAVTVYLVIKAYTNFSTGRAFPSIETISDKSGVSVPQVKRELKKLQSTGYISVEKKGRSNFYTLREKIELRDDTGRPQAVATWDYLPSSVSAAMADLKNVMMSGDVGASRIVHIERLTVNVANAGGTVINVAEMPDDLRKKISDLVKAHGKKSKSKA